MSKLDPCARGRVPRLKALAAALSIAFAGESVAVSRVPMTRIVNNANDSGAGSLREALDSAVEGDVIDLRNLSGTILLSRALEPAAGVAIVGPGRNVLTLDGGGKDRVFTSHHPLALSKVTVTHGVASSVTAGNPVTGGCIRSTSDLTLTQVTLTDCHAGAGPGSTFAYGGAVSTGSLTMVSSTISNSTASGGTSANGGGVYAFYFARLTDSVVSGNTATAPDAGGQGSGGGIACYGKVTLINSSITGNSVVAATDAAGGGLFSAQEEGPYGYVVPFITITNSTISGNTVFGGANARGGGVATKVPMFSAPFAVNNSTVAFNSASMLGGGFFIGSNSAPAFNSTIVANNTALAAPATSDFATNATMTITGNHNLVMSANPAVSLPGGTLTDDPLLQTLANNGGPTPTHALSAGSPAIDAGSNPLLLATDQRGAGFRRVSGAHADIGAFETADTIFIDGFEPL